MKKMAASISFRFSLIVFAIFVFSITYVKSHGHSHDEPSEPAAHKYSREANEAASARGPEVIEKPPKIPAPPVGGGGGGGASQQQHHHGHSHDHDSVSSDKSKVTGIHTQQQCCNVANFGSIFQLNKPNAA